MRTTVDWIKQWLEEAKSNGVTHLIVVCDRFDYEDYPVAVMPDENAREKMEEYDNKNMQKVEEVYSLALDFDEQLGKTRAFHYD